VPSANRGRLVPRLFEAPASATTSTDGSRDPRQAGLAGGGWPPSPPPRIPSLPTRSWSADRRRMPTPVHRSPRSAHRLDHGLRHRLTLWPAACKDGLMGIMLIAVYRLTPHESWVCNRRRPMPPSCSGGRPSRTSQVAKPWTSRCCRQLMIGSSRRRDPGSNLSRQGSPGRLLCGYV